MSEHTVPPLTVGDACPSGRPYPHTYDAQCQAARGESTSAALRNDLAGEALNAFMAWWSANPTLNGVEAKVGYFDHLLVEANRLRAEVDRLGLSLIRAGHATGAAMAAAAQARTDADAARDELAEVYALVEQIPGRQPLDVLREVVTRGEDARIALDAIKTKEKSMNETDDADPMITAAAEALWPHLPGEVQDGYDQDDIRPWAAGPAAAALRVMADEIDRGPTFALPPSVISALVRERADGLTGGSDV